MNHNEDCCCPCCQIPRLEKTIAEQTEQIRQEERASQELKKGLDLAVAENRQQAERIELLEASLKFQIDLGDKFQAENARLNNIIERTGQ